MKFNAPHMAKNYMHLIHLIYPIDSIDLLRIMIKKLYTDILSHDLVRQFFIDCGNEEWVFILYCFPLMDCAIQ